ncbi:MAG: hypothetical protein SVR04_10080 [Spirochaetota bacterium]|nr:hypothetical protein [Spirochaetota bacterium]
MEVDVWKGVLSRGKLDAQRSMNEANRSFFTDPRMVQLFNRYATYNGSDPYQVPATLNIIPHVEYAMGSYASKYGIYTIPQAMRMVAEELDVEHILTPDRIESDTGSYYGSLYGISSNTKTAAFLRHPARTKRYRGLYFCGGSVHPGGGMPLAILSGKIAADIIRKEEG